jgi:transglutaminase-like putative cysteine protease
MNILVLHKWLTYLMVLVPFGVLLSGGEMNPLVVAIFGVGVAVSWFRESPRFDPDRGALFWTICTAGLLALTVARVIQGGFDIAPLVDLVVLLTVIKLMQRRGPRDYVQIMALSFLLLTAASAYNQGLSFALAFALYLVIGTVTLAVKHLREELSEHHPRKLARFRVEAGFLGTVGALAVLVFLFSILFFLAFPRMGFGLFNQRARSGIAATGFNEQIRLGAHGNIREDSTIVMRASFPGIEGGRFQGDLRWRGISFHHYDGREWSNDMMSGGSGLSDDDSVYFPLDSDVDYTSPAVIRQEIYLEPLETEVLFSLPRAVAVRFLDQDSELPRSFWRQTVRWQPSGDLLLERGGSIGVGYEVFALPQAFDGGAAHFPAAMWPADEPDFRSFARRVYGRRVPDYRTTGFEPLEPYRRHRTDPLNSYDHHDRYLQLPGVLTQAFRDLAYEVIGDARTPVERARRIEAFLEASYTYTTDLPAVSASNPIESFLFDTRRGHCEYFSSAMVLLARAVGIPARNVNGFLGGDWNGIGDYYAIRQSDAHSWVELLLPGPTWDAAVWVTFDPTPPGGLPSDGEVLSGISAFFDSVRMWWYRNVVDYSLEKQIASAREVFGFFSNSENLLFDLYVFSRAALRNMGLVGVLILMWMAGLVFYVRRQRADLPWGGVDWLVGSSWLVLAELIVVLFWRHQVTTFAVLAAGFFPVATVFAAWAGRRGPRRERHQARKRRRYGTASRQFMRLVRALTRVGYQFEVSATPDTLSMQARQRSAPYADSLDETIRLYQQCRFGGDERRESLTRLRKGVRRLCRAIAGS